MFQSNNGTAIHRRDAFLLQSVNRVTSRPTARTRAPCNAKSFKRRTLVRDSQGYRQAGDTRTHVQAENICCRLMFDNGAVPGDDRVAVFRGGIERDREDLQIGVAGLGVDMGSGGSPGGVAVVGAVAPDDVGAVNLVANPKKIGPTPLKLLD